MHGLSTTVATAGGALLLVILTTKGTASALVPEDQLVWPVVHASLAIGCAFIARFLRVIAWAGLLSDVEITVMEPNWRTRAWDIYSMRYAAEYRQPIWTLEMVAFQLATAYLVCALILIVVTVL